MVEIRSKVVESLKENYIYIVQNHALSWQCLTEHLTRGLCCVPSKIDLKHWLDEGFLKVKGSRNPWSKSTISMHYSTVLTGVRASILKSFCPSHSWKVQGKSFDGKTADCHSTISEVHQDHTKQLSQISTFNTYSCICQTRLCSR